jgi:chromosome partitioning protein
MYVLSVANQKGGVGKTTTAVNVAACLAETGRRVLLVDLDPQGSATLWYGIHDAGQELYEAMVGEGELSASIRQTEVPGVWLAPAHRMLSGVERVLVSEGVGADTMLQRGLKSLGRRYDYVIVDCPPTVGYLTINAVVASSGVVVPVEPRLIALVGVGRVLELVERVNQVHGGVEVVGIVMCRVSSRARHTREVIESLRERYGDLVFRTVIRETIRLAEAMGAGPIIEYDSGGIGAVDYRGLTAEIVERIKNGKRRT